jgi:hypothetical protein
MVSATSSGMTTIDHEFLSVPKRHKNASSYKADVYQLFLAMFFAGCTFTSITPGSG